jgi:homogentisate 1,2-dioxygenase
MSAKNWIEFPRIEGEASRQAHADLPPGTYEREIGREGFFGPATHIYHRHPPTGWTSFEGPLRPRAFDARARAGKRDADGMRPVLLSQRALQMRSGLRRCDAGTWRAMPTATSCCSSMPGEGDLFCDFGHLTYRDGDYIVLPRGTMWRLDCPRATRALLIEATTAPTACPSAAFSARTRIFDPGDARYAGDRRRLPRAGRARMEGAVKRAARFRPSPIRSIRSTPWAGRAISRRCGSTGATSAR